METSERDRRTNVTAASTSFVGREADLVALAARVDEERLVTILGPPGSGKSRLALELARARARSGPEAEAGGVWTCDLSNATSAEDVCTALGLALDIPLTSGRTSADAVARLGASVAMRGPTLVVFDNADRATRSAPETIGTLIRIAPEARFIVTSRERLALPGEVLFDLGPLPQSGKDGPLASDAVRLFVERARAVRREFDVGPTDASAVTELVAHLDGLPLAIELAAARMSILGPRQLLERLRLDVLDRAAGPKRSTLRAALDGSWSVLEPNEQAALSQVAVFRGGFALEAAEEVVQLDAAPPVLDVLQSLREKSLLRSESLPDLPGELRFGMLETIRSYAEERLLGTQEAAVGAQARHAAHFLREGAAWANGVDGPSGLDGLRHLSLEAANVTEAHRRAIAEKPPSASSATRALEAVLALEPLFYTRGPARACLAMIDAALGLVERDALAPALVAAALGARGRAQRHLGALADAERDFEGALAIARRIADRSVEGRTLGDVAFLRWRQGRTEEARGLYEQALELLRATGERRLEGKVLGNLGIVLRELGRFDEAHATYERSLRAHEEVGNRRSASIVLASRGELLRAEGRLDEARESFERALPIHRAFGDRYSEGSVLADLGALLQEQGDAAEARRCFEESLACHRAFGNRAFEALALGLLGDVERETGSLEEARTFYERARHIVREIGDKRSEGRWVASLATTDAACDRIEGATASFAMAEELAEGEPNLTAAVAVHRGHLDLALARRAEATGDAARAAELRQAARGRLAAPSTGDAPLMRRSAYVRYACRLLQSAFSDGAPKPTRPPPPMRRPSEAPPAAASPARPALAIAGSGRWFELPGSERVSLQRRHALRLLLKCFLDKRLDSPGEALTLDALLEAGWPGQRVHPHAGASRVYNALTELRKMGLRDVLISRDDGYLLDRAVAVERIADDAG